MRIGFYLRAGVLFGVTAILASSAAHARPHHHGLHAAHLMRPEVSASPANHVAPTGTLKPEDHGVADTDDAFTKAGRNAGRPDQPDPAKTGSDGTLGMIKGANTGGSVKDVRPSDVHMKDLGPVDTGISAGARLQRTKPGTVRSAKTKFKVAPWHGPKAHPRLAPAAVVRNAIGVPIHPQGTDNKSSHLGASGAQKPSAANGGTGVIGLGSRPQVSSTVTTNRSGSPTPAISAMNHSSIGGSITLRSAAAPGVIGGPAKNVVGALNGTTFRQRHP